MWAPDRVDALRAQTAQGICARIARSALQKVAAQSGDLTEGQIQERLTEVTALLPDIESRLPSLKPELLLKLVQDRDAIADKLLHLKAAFPAANAGRMLANEMALMREGAESLQGRAAALRELLPNANVDAIAQVRARCASRYEALPCITARCLQH